KFRQCRKPGGVGAAALFDGHDGAAVGVELVQVLGDAVAGAPLVGPAGQTLVHDRAAVGHAVHPQQLTVQLVGPAPLVDGDHVGDRVGDAVVGQRGGDV